MSDKFKCEFAKQRKAEMLAQGAFETEDFGFACECAEQYGASYLDDDATVFQISADDLFVLMDVLGYREAPSQVHWEALTPERLAFGPLSGPYWLATDAGVVLVGDYRWEQGHDPHGFDTWGGGRVKAYRITHIAPFVTPTLPGRPA